MSLRNPQIKNQLDIFPELLADKVENKPHAARFFSYLAGILEPDMYKRSAMGTANLRKGNTGSGDFIRYVQGPF